MAVSLEVSLSKITGQLDKQDKLTKSLAKTYAEIEKTVAKISSKIGGNGGNMMGNSLAKFSGGGGGGGEWLSAGLNIAGGIASAAYGAMPSTQQVLQRATGYYNAGVMQAGSMSQTAMYNRLSNGLGKFGIQTPMATAELAQYYGTRGVTIGSAYEGSLTRAVGGAARMFNMDTNRAAAALEGMTSGPMSMNLLQTMGIFTANPRTGEAYTQQQLFDQIHGRLTAGRRQASVTDVQESFRRGNLGSFLRNSGLSEDQQQMYYMSELYRADTGKSLDMSNQQQVDAAMASMKKKGYINPQESLNQIAASEEGVLQAAQQPYIAGLQAAVPLIQGMNKGLEGVVANLGQFKAFLETLGSTNAGSAAKGIVGDLGNAALLSIAARGGGVGAGAASGAAKALGVLGKGLGVAGGVVGVASGAMGAAESAKQGNGWGVFGNILMSTASGALAGAPFGGWVGAGIGAAIGLGAGIVGAISGGQGGGADSGFGYNGQGAGGTGAKASTSSAAKGSATKVKFYRPAAGSITSGYGPRKAPTTGASTFHRGVDIANSQGSPIVASADGKVIFRGSNGSYGNQIKIQHGGGYITTYGHMSRFAVRIGQQVVANQRIGSMGATGVATGPHVHFEVLKNGAPIDPATVVSGLGGSGGISIVAGKPSKAGGAGSAALGTATGASVADTAASETSGSTFRDILGGREVSLLGVTGGSLSISQGASATLAGVDQNEGMFGSRGGVSLSSAGHTGMGGGETSTMRGGGISGGSLGGGNNVTINLTIGKASDAEARKFAKIVKDILEEKQTISKIGSM